MHANDYMVYAYFQLGQDKKAHTVIDEMNTVAGFKRPISAAGCPPRSR
jgi:hypothetical protein